MFGWKSKKDSSRRLEFCAFDFETTGFGKADRVLEVAAVRFNERGEILARYETLINPERDISNSDIHGVTASLIKDAPRFSEIAGDLSEIFQGAILLAHNASFDMRFLRQEFGRIPLEVPEFPFICSMKFVGGLDDRPPRLRLGDCCSYYDIEYRNAHSAAADVEATVELFLCCKEASRLEGARLLECCGVGEFSSGAVWPGIEKSGLSYKRSHAVEQARTARGSLSGLLSEVSVSSDAEVDAGEYLCLLDQVLEDRIITSEESESLITLAGELGLNRERVIEVHEEYLKAIVCMALADDKINAAEQADIQDVAKLLSVPPLKVDSLVSQARLFREEITRKLEGLPYNREITGQSICFTGKLQSVIEGEPASRPLAESIAKERGMEVKSGVSKKLDYLVAADTDSFSGKAKKAREYGVRILAEPVFWNMMGVQYS